MSHPCDVSLKIIVPIIRQDKPAGYFFKNIFIRNFFLLKNCINFGVGITPVMLSQTKIIVPITPAGFPLPVIFLNLY